MKTKTKTKEEKRDFLDLFVEGIILIFLVFAFLAFNFIVILYGLGYIIERFDLYGWRAGGLLLIYFSIYELMKIRRRKNDNL